MHTTTTSVGFGEARAWFRGRYSHLPLSNIDSISKYFHPNMGQSDTLTGGQFFAVFRLVICAEGGGGVDRDWRSYKMCSRFDSIRPFLWLVSWVRLPLSLVRRLDCLAAVIVILLEGLSFWFSCVCTVSDILL